MLSILTYIIVGGIGLLIAHLLSRPPELRSLRLSQLILVPAAMVGAFCLLPRHSGGFNLGDLQNFLPYVAIAGFIGLLLGPNIAFHVGIGVSNFIDPQDWTPLEEEIALRPIIKLIDNDRYQEALSELDDLLKKHKPTYEALMFKSKLLHHFSSVDETTATLLKMIPLSHTTEQQLAVMECLATFESKNQAPSGLFVPQTRRLRIFHELLLFPPGATNLSSHKTIPPGEYEVEETLQGARRWLKLKRENWGNAEICWQAVQEMCPTNAGTQNRSFLAPIIRMHRAISNVISRRQRFQMQPQSRESFK